MLEIKNITKTYRPKKGVPVKALDDVSLSFANRGLVFVLGKSGSGKSTLLNVIGGLDKADSGEFIIKGKSSKSFSQSDFDAYRNTFIGFIFQEYNILNEFSVGQNIALAMELQGKRATKDALKKILDEVDLPGYETRKPNELSGGQKQRIAIARALVKEPEIIMADEPTGALDSNTGKQVFETLKKLSQNKLVIVVSHDREFAEYYGDRVIELADGKIISDISKYEAEPDVKSTQVSIIDQKIVHIKKGSELTEKDFAIIREYIKKTQGDILISSDERSNASLKQIAMISDDGSKASFKATDEGDVPILSYTPNDSKFIKSRLPYRNALKIGASSIKTKPIRLFFTILLSFVSFAMFGLADTFSSYSRDETAARSIVSANIPYASFAMTNNTLEGEGDRATIRSTPTMGDDNSKTQLEDDTGLTVYPVYRGIDGLNSNVMIPSLTVTSVSNYYIPYVAGVTEIGQSELDEMNYQVVGKMPSADNEIAITKYQFDTYNYYGFAPIRNDESAIAAGEATEIGSDKSIIGKHIKFNIYGSAYQESLSEKEFEIVGIVDTKLDAKYDDLKHASASGSNFSDYVMINEFRNIITSGIHGMMFINPGLLEDIMEANLATRTGISYDSYLSFRQLRTNSSPIGVNMRSIIPLASMTNLNQIAWLSGSQSSLEDNDVILPFSLFYELESSLLGCETLFPSATLYTQYYNQEANDFATVDTSTWVGEYNISTYNSMYLRALYTDTLVRYVKENPVPQSFKDASGGAWPTDLEWQFAYLETLLNWGISEPRYADFHLLGAKLVAETFGTFVNDNNYFAFDDIVTMKKGEDRGDNTVSGDPLNVVGLKMSNGSIDYNDTTIVVSDSFYNSISVANQNYYVGFIGVMPKGHDDIMKIVRYSYDGEAKTGLNFVLQNQVMAALVDINSMVEMTSELFLYIGIGLAIFSALLLANFIAVSIANKKREIGILRAVGAKSRDVFTIFFNESIIIALINFALAVIGSFATCLIFNNFFMRELGVSISILAFGVRQVVLMFAVSIGVAIIASFLPVMTIARKQPIDSIQDR